MARRSSSTSMAVKPPNSDDLKRINGIGPGVESRLHGVGIYTFAQLATLSPADIAASVSGLASLTTERIIKQNWIGQARTLALESALTDPKWEQEVYSTSIREVGRINDRVRRLSATSASPALCPLFQLRLFERLLLFENCLLEMLEKPLFDISTSSSTCIFCFRRGYWQFPSVDHHVSLQR